LSEGENTGAITRNISISDLLKEESISLDDEAIKSNDIVLVPQQKSPEDVIIIKKLRQHGARVWYPSEGLYVDARGGIWETPLMIISDFAMGVVTTILVEWITAKVKQYRESKKINVSSNDDQQPLFRARLYLIREQKYIEVSRDAQLVEKVLKSLNHG
jgi:hypothetical protein